MGYTGAKRNSRDAGTFETFENDADHSSWTLVRRLTKPENFGEFCIGGGTRDRGWPRMRYLSDHGAERDHHRDIEVVDDVHDGIGKGAPHQMGLHPLHQNQVAVLVGQKKTIDSVFGPVDDPPSAFGDA